jgi:cytochrome c peroxidase
MVLSPEEDTLWVHCSGTNDLVEVRLMVSASADSGEDESGVQARLRLLPDPLGPGGATGRKLFHNSTDFAMSGGLACAGCHPEGRDDGHVWHEATFTTEDGDTTNFVGHAANIPKEAHAQGYARRTPMLAGRVAAPGPYGWHAESPSIVARELQGFGLHRWGVVPTTRRAEQEKRARALFDFLRRGLVPPARVARSLTPKEKVGEELFSSKALGCADCHPPTRGYTTRQAYPLPLLPLAAGFDEDPNGRYKIPGLTFLAGRAPYFHDGSAASLEELIANNGSRMGNTAQLTDAERAALVAFLKTL